MTTTTIPNLAGVIKTSDLYKKMKFDYVPWAKTAQLLREHAPGWQFFLKPSNPNGDIFSYVHLAPDNTGFLMGYFEHIETGKQTSPNVFAITDNANRPVQLERISCNNIQNSHRRCLCACACKDFGLAYELWAQIEIDEAKQVAPEPKKGIARTPTKPKQEPDPVESIEDKNYGNPIAKPVLDVLVKKIMSLSEKYPDKKDEVLNKYKKEYKITAEKIGPADIRTAEQGKFLTLLINEIDSSL
tara:strand:+ start:5512 stop:6240 length:729 start_codon:yes stop_codon:yes gene_type:complete